MKKNTRAGRFVYKGWCVRAYWRFQANISIYTQKKWKYRNNIGTTDRIKYILSFRAHGKCSICVSICVKLIKKKKNRIRWIDRFHDIFLLLFLLSWGCSNWALHFYFVYMSSNSFRTVMVEHVTLIPKNLL